MKPQISESMSKKIFTVYPDAKIVEAYQAMREKRIRHLLVVDKDQMVCGVLSDRDVNRAMATRIEKTDHLKIVAERFNPEDEVQDFMTWEVKTLSIDEPLKQVAFKMLNDKISSVVVLDKARQVCGLVTSDDLLWVLTKLLDTQELGTLEKLKADILASPLGWVANTLSQSGI